MDKIAKTLPKPEIGTALLTFSKKALALFSSKKASGSSLSAEKRELLSDIDATLADLRYARTCFAEATDPEIIEACVYEIKSAESRYGFLLRRAKLLAEKEKEQITL